MTFIRPTPNLYTSNTFTSSTFVYHQPNKRYFTKSGTQDTVIPCPRNGDTRVSRKSDGPSVCVKITVRTHFRAVTHRGCYTENMQFLFLKISSFRFSLIFIPANILPDCYLSGEKLYFLYIKINFVVRGYWLFDNSWRCPNVLFLFS